MSIADPAYLYSSYKFDIGSDICEKKNGSFRVRNNNFWAVSKNRVLVYADLTPNTENTPKTIAGTEGCMFLFVSPNGEYCIVRCAKKMLLIGKNTLSPVEIQLPAILNSPTHEIDTVSCVCWLCPPQYHSTIAFFGTQNGQIFYINVNRPKMISFYSQGDNLLDIPHSMIHGMSIFPLKNGTFVFSFVIVPPQRPNEKSPRAIILDQNLGINESLKKKGGAILPYNKQGDLIMDENIIAALIMTKESKTECLCFNVAYKDTNQEKLLDKIMNFALDSPFNGIQFFNDLVFIQSNQTLSIKRINWENEIGEINEILKFTIPNGCAFDFDKIKKLFYFVNNDQIWCYSLDGREENLIGESGFYYMMHKAYTGIKDHNNAILNLLRTKLPYHRLCSIMGKELSHLFHLHMCLINSTNDSKISIKSMLYCTALDIRIRLELKKSKPDVESFINWAKTAISNKFLSENRVKESLEKYGWFEPFSPLFGKVSRIEYLLSTGDYQSSVGVLNDISDPKMFIDSAQRLYHSNKVLVSNIIYQKIINNSLAQKDTNCLVSYLVSLLLDEHHSDSFIKLFKDRIYIYPWQSDLFIRYVSQRPTKELIMTFFDQNNFNIKNDEKMLMLRSLVKNNHNDHVTEALKMMKLYVAAAYAGAKVSPDLAFSVINSPFDQSTKDFCLNIVFRSLRKEDAGELAKKLIVQDQQKTGNNMISTILNFLPEESLVYLLKPSLDKFNQGELSKIFEQEKIIANAKSGIDKANSLIGTKSVTPLDFQSSYCCEKCKKTLATEPGIIFPCKHGYHEKCIREICEETGVEIKGKIDLFVDCPSCGFLAVSQIDLPFHKKESSAVGAWTIELEQLNMIN